MRKKLKKVLSLLIVFVMVFSINTVTFASSSEKLGSSSVVIEENGIYINGNYYTQHEFELLLDTAQKIDRPTPRMAGALVAGTWFIPGIGEVVITAAGVITVAGVVAKAGSWIYNQVVKWSKDKQADQEYEQAKEEGKPTNNHSTQVGSSLPTKGSPRSSKDLKDKNGKLKQRRYYDKNGNADLDIDYSHGGNGKYPFPHRHRWINGKREAH